MKVTLILSLLISSFYSSAQHYLGFKVGLNNGRLTRVLIQDDILPHTGITGDLEYGFIIKNKVVLSTGVNFTRTGQDYEFIYTDNQGNGIDFYRLKNIFNQLTVPFTFGFAFGKNLMVTPKIGITTDINLSCYSKYPDGLFEGTSKIYFTEQVKPVNFSILGGIEFSKNIKDISIFGSLDYRHSLSHIYKDAFSTSEFDIRLMNLRLQLGFRYLLPSKE